MDDIFGNYGSGIPDPVGCGKGEVQLDTVARRLRRRIGRSRWGRIVPAEFDAPMAAGCLTAPESLTFMIWHKVRILRRTESFVKVASFGSCYSWLGSG